MLIGTSSRGAAPISNAPRTRLEELEAQISTTKRMRDTARTVREYREWCESRPTPYVAFPASYKSVGGYLAEKVTALAGSSKTVRNWVSSLCVYSTTQGIPWLSPGDLIKLKRIRRQLELDDKTDVERKRPFVLAMIQDALQQEIWRPQESDYDLLCATVVLVGHNGLLRGGELLYGLRGKDVTWNNTGSSVSLHLAWTKTARRGCGVDVRITDYPGPSAYKFLHRWYFRRSMHKHGDMYVFPRAVQAGVGREVSFDHSVPAGVRWLRVVIKDAVAKLGRDPHHYSGHSLRAGGATDLFVLRVPYPQIKKYGRWDSDAAMVYYRDEIEVSVTVAKAFGRVRREGRRREHVYDGVGVKG